MPACTIDWPNGTADYLFVLFHSEVRLGSADAENVWRSPVLMVWTPADSQYYGNAQSSWDHSWFRCSGNEIDPILKACGIPVREPIAIAEPSLMEHFLFEAAAELHGWDQPNAKILRNLFENFIQDVARHAFGKRKHLIPNRLLAIRSYLEQHFTEQLRLPKLAKLAGCSQSHLCTEFRRFFGVPISKFALQLRMSQATYLLRDRHRRVGDIAASVGYPDLFTFSKMFKRYVGMSPKNFRERNAQKDLITTIDAPKQWHIGFSQVTTTEPWRVLFNNRMREEAAKYPYISLTIADGEDRTDKQVADIQEFIRQRVDVIMISPKESVGLTEVVEQATLAGIPVIVLDRDVATKKYTQFIGSDNLKIGHMAGEYAVECLGGKGKAKGNIVEIWGGMASTPAQERHKRFAQYVGTEPGIVPLVDRQDADWKQDRAYNIMAAALKAHPKIDLVFAHNDSMAFGAYLAAKEAGRSGTISFIGIDGIFDERATWIKQGVLSATFVYETPGEEAIRQALRILKGEPIRKRIELETQRIDATNVGTHLAQRAL